MRTLPRNGTLEGIFGTATHELGHLWFQHVLVKRVKASLMDEGFTTYISDLAENELSDKKVANPFRRKLQRILQFSKLR
jgi:hypothetical protein